MNNEKNNLLKLIGSKLTHLAVIISFVLITTYFVLAGQGQESKSTLSTNLNTEEEVQFEPRLNSAALPEIELMRKISTIEHNPVFKTSPIVQLLSNLPLDEAFTEQIEENPTIDKSTFALLQNNPTLGKSSVEEGETESAPDASQDEQIEDETLIDTPEQSESEIVIEDSTPEQEESEPIQESPTDEAIENDPALDITIITQQPSFPYSEKLPLPYEHQEYLYSLCMNYGLDYEKVLAVMEHESKFDPNAIGATSDFGYFQINSINHQWLSETLGTPNDPLDPYVNMQWGTYFLSDLIDYWEKEGLTGEALDDAVLSSYNKGITGYRRTGKAVNYVEKVRTSYALIQNEYMVN